ncbi:MAG: hypothetical protein NXI30_12370 [bacterium]|nr:hypothetical protein [bacterium]
MPTRPFYVQRNGECIPLEGDWRVAEIDGDWYVLGHHSVVPCGSERAAHSMLAELAERTDIDALANEAIEGLDRIPEAWESESLGEAELSR